MRICTLKDGTPLYFEWLIEGKDGALYIVPAQPDGWLRRKPFNERIDSLISVPPQIAEAVVRLTHAEVDDPGHLGAVSTGDYRNYTEHLEYMYHS